MLKISWKGKVINESVVEKADEKKCVLNTIWQRKHRWLGHVLRNDVLLRDIIEGRMEDRAYRRRKRPCWV